MIEQQKSRALLRALVCIGLPVAAAMALSACSTTEVRDDTSKVVSYVYRPQVGYVRIERIETGAPDNDYPFDISPDALSRLLASLEVKGGEKTGAAPLFNDEELKEFVPYLVAALAKARPKEDVCFAVVGKHGPLGSYSPPSVTTGRLFARDGHLNVILGLVQEHFEGPDVGFVDSLTPRLPPGSRLQASNTGWKLLPKGGRLADGRSDWIALDTPPPPAARQQPPGTAPTPATADSRYQEAQSRLIALDRLKADGLITQQEYDERRRAILQGL